MQTAGCFSLILTHRTFTQVLLGVGAAPSVLAGYLLQQMAAKKYRHILFCGTGALHSPLSMMQGESIPGICHAVAISRRKEQEHE